MTLKRIFLVQVVAILLLALSPAHAARQDTVQVIIPWEAEGQVFQVDTHTMLFLGAMEGIMYIESSRGEMHEAFVQCPIMQKLDLETGATEVTGRCEISASPVDVLYAELSCKGEIGDCKGEFTLIDGEGRFAGISGTGELRVRSPIQGLIAGLGSGAILRVGSGLAIVKDLKYRIP